MIELIARVCSIVAGATCTTVTLTFHADGVTQHECLLYGQFELAKWQGDHPNWHVARWRCGVAGQTAHL